MGSTFTYILRFHDGKMIDTNVRVSNATDYQLTSKAHVFRLGLCFLCSPCWHIWVLVSELICFSSTGGSLTRDICRSFQGPISPSNFSSPVMQKIYIEVYCCCELIYLFLKAVHFKVWVSLKVSHTRR